MTSAIPTDAALARLGIHRIPSPVPFVSAGGPVNAWALEEQGGGIALFDTGLGTDEGEQALREGLAAHGFSVRDVRRVLVSHGHVDHFGLAGIIAAESGARVFLHEADATKVRSPGERLRASREALHARLLRMGCDPEDLERLERVHGTMVSLAPPFDDLQPLVEGDRILLKHFEAVVQHRPGHTPGLVCLYDEEHGLLFAGDHLLERVSPNPLLEMARNPDGTPFEALVEQLRSLERTRAIDPACVLPGHDVPFGGAAKVIDSLCAFYTRRQARLRAFLSPDPPTAVELVRRLFPRAARAELMLTLSEIVGNLEVLRRRGLARTVDDGTHERWEAVATDGVPPA